MVFTHCLWKQVNLQMLPRKTESLLGWLFGCSFPKNILQYKVCSTEHSVEFILGEGGRGIKNTSTSQ